MPLGGIVGSLCGWRAQNLEVMGVAAPWQVTPFAAVLRARHPPLQGNMGSLLDDDTAHEAAEFVRIRA